MSRWLAAGNQIEKNYITSNIIPYPTRQNYLTGSWMPAKLFDRQSHDTQTILIGSWVPAK